LSEPKKRDLDLADQLGYFAEMKEFENGIKWDIKGAAKEIANYRAEIWKEFVAWYAVHEGARDRGLIEKCKKALCASNEKFYVGETGWGLPEAIAAIEVLKGETVAIPTKCYHGEDMIGDSEGDGATGIPATGIANSAIAIWNTIVEDAESWPEDSTPRILLEAFRAMKASRDDLLASLVKIADIEEKESSVWRTQSEVIAREAIVRTGGQVKAGGVI
jgi:hypothetical protein